MPDLQIAAYAVGDEHRFAVDATDKRIEFGNAEHGFGHDVQGRYELECVRFPDCGVLMSIKTETLEGGLVRTFSDAAMMVRQDGTGILYQEAVDPETSDRTYTETTIPAPLLRTLRAPDHTPYPSDGEE